jgi:hypothetical protein
MSFRSEGGLHRPENAAPSEQGARALRSAPALLRVRARPGRLAPTVAEARGFDAFLILNEFRVDAIRVFASAPLEVGSEVSVSIQAPRKFFARARVAACFDPVLNRRILHASPHNYRVTLIFEPSSELEAEGIAQFYREVQLLLGDLSDLRASSAAENPVVGPMVRGA